jgi:hypothetical protein
MNSALKVTLGWWPALILPLLFFALGWVLLPYAGLQNDEVLFATPDFHQTSSSIFTIPLPRFNVPVMLLSYLGALKTWLYAPFITRIRPSYLTVRLPALLIGAMTIGIFVWFLEKVHSRRAAWVGGVLLATDTMYLLTTCFDWGPVVLQHLLSVAGLALLLKFATSRSPSALFFGFLSFGLGMWDKALFVWLLLGLTVAALAVFPKELWSRCSWRALWLAAAGFGLGALPLLIYNASSGFATFRTNSSFALNDFPVKVQALRTSWDGSSLFHYIVNSPSGPGQAQDPRSGLERMSFQVHAALGDHNRNRLEAGFGVTLLLLLPLLVLSKHRRILLFSLITIGVGWLQMAITKNAGEGAHHVVLLWPIPHWFMAVALTEASLWQWLRWRRMGECLLAMAILYLAAENLLVTNQYLYQLVRYGAARNWSDAIYRLSDETARWRGFELVVDDWGIMNPLVVLQRGRLPLILVEGSFMAPGESEKMRSYEHGLVEHDIWIGHTPPYQEFIAINEHIQKSAESLGFRKQLIELVPDRNGRPVYEVFRFVRGD